MMRSRHLHVDVLSVLFGIGTWLCVNGLWVELPLLVQHLPEGWALPSYIAVIIQLSNLGPITYTILNSFFPTTVTEKRSIYVVMILGFVSVLLLAHFWMEAIPVFGQPHSVALFVLVFVLASVDCSSRVLYLPFMARFKPEYLTSFFIGEGLSGFVPSIFALVQGAGGSGGCVNSTVEDANGTVTTFITSAPPDPLFSIEIFMYLMAFITFLSAVAFYLLNCPSVVGKSLIVEGRIEKGQEGQGDILLRSPSTKFYNSTPPLESERKALSDATAVEQSDLPKISTIDIQNDSLFTKPKSRSYDEALSKSEFAFLMVLLTFICSLANGIFPSIQSYSCLPYGNSTYHWTVTLSSMANPAVCFLTFYLQRPSKIFMTVMSGVSVIIGGYIMYTAVMSPAPPMVGNIWGQALLIASWILLVGLFTYVKVSIATITRVMGKTGLFWTGAFTQLGSSVGALIAFLIVNYGNVFHSFNPCGQ